MQIQAGRKILHVNLDKVKKQWFVKKTFNILVEPGKVFLDNNELEQWIQQHPDVRVVCRHV